jgi:hypothetical protein
MRRVLANYGVEAFLLLLTGIVLGLGLACLLPASGAQPAWHHPLAVVVDSGRADWSVRGRRTADLYRWAISHDVPIRTWQVTYYHPHESGGEGGGWSTADGGGFRPDCVASARRWYPYWRGHELWVEGHGRVTVGDNGPGWGSKTRFDLPGLSGRWVDDHERYSHDDGIRRVVVVWCPRPRTCGCDYAQAWRRAHQGKP